LDNRGLAWEHEPFTSGSNPDFVVHHPAGQVVMDVTEPHFRLPRGPDGQFSGWIGPTPQGAIRRPFNDARKKAQAKVALDAGLPFVVVLARSNSDMEFTDHEVVGALFGSLAFTFPVGRDEPSGDDGRFVFGGGRLQPTLNTRFSAAAVLSGFNPGTRSVERLTEQRLAATEAGLSPEDRLAHAIQTILEVTKEQEAAGQFLEGERTYRLTIFHNPDAAIPLSPRFAGPHDDQWMGTREVGAYYEASWGALGYEVPNREVR
jgi:hypothetical protein